MKAGPLDRRITIQRLTITDDGYGGAIETWADLTTLSAQFIQQSGREFLAAEQTQAEQRVLFRLRWLDGLTVLDRVSYEGRLYDIQDVKEIGRRQGVELMAAASV